MLVKPERAKIFAPEETEDEFETIAEESTEEQLGDILGSDDATVESSDAAIDDDPESDDDPASDGPTFADAETESHVDDDRQFWYEAELFAKIADSSRERERSFGIVSRIKEDLKEAKEELKEAKEELSAVEARLFRLTAELGRKLAPVPATALVEVSATNGIETEAEDNSWRDLPTVELLTGLTGLGKKKIETLSEAVPTVGDLEDLRGKASEQHKSFAELLPKGFGQKAVDSIENALIDHIANYSASMTPAVNQPYEHFPWVIKQEETCRNTLATYEPPVPSDADYEWYSDGAESFEDGAPITECPVRSEEVSEDDQVDWMFGWLMTEKLSK